MKFGGTSVANRERLVCVGKLIREQRERDHDVVVVVSAQGNHTDELFEKAREVTSHPSEREMDVLLSTGELVSAALLAMMLREQQCPAVSLSARQMGFHTDSHHGSARILEVDTERIHRELSFGNVVVCTGFQGINDQEDITTLGRGGSDTSAVALAAALGAEVCRIYTDVAGIYTADPRHIPTARRLPALSFDEMLEMSSLGAQVLLGRAVELAKRYGVTIQVLSSFVEESGTEVNEVGFEGMLIKGIVQDDGAALVTVKGVPLSGDALRELFRCLGDAKLTVQHVAMGAVRRGKRDITFVVREEQAKTVVSLVRRINKKYNIEDVSCDRDVSCISVVGAGLTGYADVPCRLLAAVSREGADAKHLSGSDTKITVVVGRKEAGSITAAMHKEFIE